MRLEDALVALLYLCLAMTVSDWSEGADGPPLLMALTLKTYSEPSVRPSMVPLMVPSAPIFSLSTGIVLPLCHMPIFFSYKQRDTCIDTHLKNSPRKTQNVLDYHKFDLVVRNRRPSVRLWSLPRQIAVMGSPIGRLRGAGLGRLVCNNGRIKP